MADMTKTSAWWNGKRVLVHQCLTVKPTLSEEPGGGWLFLDADFDPDDREPCEAVGLVGAFDHPQVVAVFFLDEAQEPSRETAVFAHVDDLEWTAAPYSWPDVEGLNVNERGRTPTVEQPEPDEGGD